MGMVGTMQVTRAAYDRSGAGPRHAGCRALGATSRFFTQGGAAWKTSHCKLNTRAAKGHPERMLTISMFGFILAATSAFGLYLLSRKRHRRLGSQHALRHVFSRLDTTPGQEKTIREALLRVKDGAKRLTRELSSSRSALAELLTQPEFDEVRVNEWVAARERSFWELKPEVMQSLREIHEVLDEEQRKKLSRWVESGPNRVFSRRGPHGHGYGHVC